MSLDTTLRASSSKVLTIGSIKPKSFLTTLQEKVKHIAQPIINNPTTSLRIYNGLVATVVLSKYLLSNEPLSASEYLMDVVIHGVQACVTLNSPDMLKTAAGILNVARLGAIYTYSSDSTIPVGLNYLDIANHSINIAGTAILWCKNEVNKLKKKE